MADHADHNAAPYDACVIGGGINGVGIARDLSGRGASVLLLEAGDLAQATSSASTKLIHGGLRYLEHYEFRLVREALHERETILGMAPHITWPLTFILPHDRHLRPAWLIRLGLFLYDHLAGRKKLEKSRAVSLPQSPYGTPLSEKYTKAFSYADGWVDDARLVILNALDAKERGAVIRPRTTCTKLTAQEDHWAITAHNQRTGKDESFRAKTVVNAAGPWVRDFLDSQSLSHAETPDIRLVKGSHIIIPRLYEGAQAYILQLEDERIIFAIPYEDNYTLVGTTDVDYEGDPADVAISADEISYLCEGLNRAFDKQTTPADIIHCYSGVRPLINDGHNAASAVTRDYQLITDDRFGPRLLSVFGGKITTYRKLGEQAADIIFKGPHWTDKEPLPGGDMGEFSDFIIACKNRYPWLPEDVLTRYARQYGTRLDKVIGSATNLDDLGRDFGGGLYEAEIHYLIEYEWADTVEDIIWRRTKRGMHLAPEALESLKRAWPDLVAQKNK